MVVTVPTVETVVTRQLQQLRRTCEDHLQVLIDLKGIDPS